MHAPGPGGAARACALSTGAALTPRRFSKQRKRFIRARAIAMPPPSCALRRCGVSGDHRASATAANRGQVVASMLELSTVSPHIAPPPPRTKEHCLAVRASQMSACQSLSQVVFNESRYLSGRGSIILLQASHDARPDTCRIATLCGRGGGGRGSASRQPPQLAGKRLPQKLLVQPELPQCPKAAPELPQIGIFFAYFCVKLPQSSPTRP